MSAKKYNEKSHKDQSKHGHSKLGISSAPIKPISDLDLSGLMNGKLLTVTHEIVERANKPVYSSIPQKIKDYCAWLPEYAKYGPLPPDCKRQIQAIYSYLSREDKNSIKEKAQEIRARPEQHALTESPIVALVNSA